MGQAAVNNEIEERFGAPPRAGGSASRGGPSSSRTTGEQKTRGVWAGVETSRRAPPFAPGRTGWIPNTKPSDRYAPRQWPAGMRRDMQRLLVSAGLLNGDYAEGVWDAETVAAYADAIDIAAENGVSVQEMLRQLSNATFIDPETGERRRGPRGAKVEPETQYATRQEFVPQTYRSPDPATLTALTRQTIAQLLGRNPSSDEIAAVQGDLQRWFREAYDAETESMRLEHETTQDASIRETQALASATGTPLQVVGGPASSGAAPGTVPEVDPAEKLAELLRQRYASEIGRVGQREVTGRTGQVLTGATGDISSAIFGAANRGQV